MAGQSPRDATVLYKILTRSQYESLPRHDQAQWPGVGIDLADGFIHLSTSHQLVGTLDRFFSPSTDVGDTLYISALPLDKIKKNQYTLKFEPAAGTEFGHIYGHIIPASDFVQHHAVHRDVTSGKFKLPDLQF